MFVFGAVDMETILAQFVKSAGKAGGQTIYGGTEAGEALTLSSTAHATKGKVNIGGAFYFDEVNGYFGNVPNPANPLYMIKNEDSLQRLAVFGNSSAGEAAVAEFTLQNNTPAAVSTGAFGSNYKGGLFNGTQLAAMARLRSGSGLLGLIITTGGTNRYLAFGAGGDIEQMRIATTGISIGSRAAQTGATATAKARLDVTGLNALAANFAQLWRSLGAELITAANDRTFGGAGNWTGANWAVSAGVLLHTAGSAAAATLTSANMTASQIKADNLYRVIFVVAGRTAGTLTPALGAAAGVAASMNGTHVQDIFAAADDASLTFTPSPDFDGSIDNISVLRLAPVAGVNNLGRGDFAGVRVTADPGSGVAGAITETNDVAGTPANTSTPSAWRKVYDGTTVRYMPLYT